MLGVSRSSLDLEQTWLCLVTWNRSLENADWLQSNLWHSSTYELMLGSQIWDLSICLSLLAQAQQLSSTAMLPSLPVLLLPCIKETALVLVGKVCLSWTNWASHLNFWQLKSTETKKILIPFWMSLGSGAQLSCTSASPSVTQGCCSQPPSESHRENKNTLVLWSPAEKFAEGFCVFYYCFSVLFLALTLDWAEPKNNQTKHLHFRCMLDTC